MAMGLRRLDQYPFHFVETDLIIPPIVQAGRPSGFLIGHLLGDLELAAISKVLGDAGRTERVVADLRPNSSRRCPAANHPVDVWLGDGIVGQLTAAAAGRSRQSRARARDGPPIP